MKSILLVVAMVAAAQTPTTIETPEPFQVQATFTPVGGESLVVEFDCDCEAFIRVIHGKTFEDLGFIDAASPFTADVSPLLVLDENPLTLMVYGDDGEIATLSDVLLIKSEEED
jgi:hypothetical protein